MTVSRIALAIVGLSMVAAPAFAQTSMPSNTTLPTASSSSINYMTTMKAGEWRASKLKGVNVYNTANEKIGDVNEILIDNTGKITAVVIGAGGFLGMGEHDVAVAFSSLKPVMDAVQMSGTATTRPATNTAANNNAATAPRTTSNDVTGTTATATAAAMDRGYPDHFLLDATKDQLKAAPQFSYSAVKK